MKMDQIKSCAVEDRKTKIKIITRMIATRGTDLPPRRTPRIAHTRSTGTPPTLKQKKKKSLDTCLKHPPNVIS